ncbi:MAG: bifunctional sulfate adenylyltransferase/adenylylsulfate kinase [Planctomycetota bacterium]|jgi:sulfate adenylyltransferase
MNKDNSGNLIRPYKGKLLSLLVSGKERAELIGGAFGLPYIQLSPRSVCDLELLACGALSPLDGFMGKKDYESVLDKMRLSDGTLFPMPVTLPVHEQSLPEKGNEIALRSPNNELLGVMHIEEKFEWDPGEEAKNVLGTTDARHPLVAEMDSWGKTCISGPINALNMPEHHDFSQQRLTPEKVRALLAENGRSNAVAFQPRGLLHRGVEELTKRAARDVEGALLIQVDSGSLKPGDMDQYTRMRIYRLLAEKYYGTENTILNLLPLAMRHAGPREALWHAIIHRNYGATHFLLGPDHAAPGIDSSGKPFYDPHASRELMQEHEDEIGIKTVPYSIPVYLPDENRYEEIDKAPAGKRQLSISDIQVRKEFLDGGGKLPEWFVRPEVAGILREAYPPRYRQGFCVWFTGLPSAGKSTIALILTQLLAEYGRQVTLLDGDVVRTHLSKGLGFSKVDRDTNIRRIGFVAAEIARHNGTVICAAVSPYRATRNQVRNMVGKERFIECFVDTPLDVCEKRDIKGMYAKAHRGEIRKFTGVDDPYENPIQPEIVVETVENTAEECAGSIIDYLISRGLLEK